MKFSEEYIEICRKLPPHEFEVGDWAYWEDIQSGIVVICQIIDDEDGPWLVGDIDGDSYGKYPDELTCWLPHRESDWMKMKGWGNWTIELNGSIFVVAEQLAPGVIASSLNPLMACAKAWEKAVGG